MVASSRAFKSLGHFWKTESEGTYPCTCTNPSFTLHDGTTFWIGASHWDLMAIECSRAQLLLQKTEVNEERNVIVDI